MSLFPAYATDPQCSTANSTNPNDNIQWLSNSSFQIDVTPTVVPATPEEIQDIPIPPVKRKHKDKSRKHKKHKKEEELLPQTSTEDFSIDKTRNKEFLTVNTISRPAVPRYKSTYFSSKLRKFKKKRKIKRYYHISRKKDDDKSNSEEEVITQKNMNEIKVRKDENCTTFKQEVELSETTANYNRELAKDPQDIKLWIKYVNFQDVVYQFEKTHRKGSIAKGLRVLAERKLTILDKALNLNSGAEELLRQRLIVAVNVYPADELHVQLKNLVEKDQGNIILWQGYIESYQCSMSHCNTPTVLDLYNKCLSVLHKLRRNSTVEKAVLEESILRMLYQCGLFLKQAGLFEQLWTLMRLYLELNLAPTNERLFNIGSSLDENQLIELEEVVFKSQLPLHELWLRTEKLRESCHWLPYSENGDCEDPQRFVFPEDVAELIHPITMSENTFKLIATILSLLKIPLLPCRHSTFQDLGLDYVPWALDSIEALLPIFLNSYPVDLSNTNLIIDNRLAVGPQYLKVLPGQAEYLHFVLTTFKNCADSAKGNDQIATTIWWIRFQKLLITLETQNRFKMPVGSIKKLRTNIKNLLKQEGNRDNLIYFCEYALVEYESGNKKNCLNIIETSLKSRNSNISMETENQAALCYLNRILIEIYLRDEPNDRVKALKQLVSLVLEKDYSNLDITQEILKETNLKFKHITLKLLQKETPKLTAAEQFLPDFFTEWIICNGWFIYLSNGPIECGTFLEEILENITSSFQKEVIYEFYVTVIFKHCLSNPGYGIYKILDDILYRAIENYPNNLYFLATLAREQSITNCTGVAWWKVKSLLIKTGRALPIVFLILIANQQINELQDSLIDTFSGKKFLINDNMKNRMLSLFRRITRSDMCTRRCGLVWRLYLQFVHTYFDPGLCRNVYYTAVEDCPWLKALYIDAAIYIPAELAQIQDLLIEKQLRLHVTPEELEVLRS